MRRAAAAALVALCTAAPAAAELRRVVSEGAVAVREGESAGGSLRDSALADAIRRAVDEVAGEMAGTRIGSGPDAAERLDAALGEDRSSLAARFRIARAAAVRARSLLADPDVAEEYALAAEVWVDVARVRRKLEDAGLLAGGSPGRAVTVVLEPLSTWRAVELVGEALGGVPRQIERGRAVLVVETTASPDELLDRLERAAPSDLRVGAASVEGDLLRVAIDAAPSASGRPVEGSRDLTP